jgi:hypothetical protein
MTNLENLETMIRYYRERIACAQATGDIKNARRLERNLAAFEHILDLEHKRTLAATRHPSGDDVDTTLVAVRGLKG